MAVKALTSASLFVISLVSVFAYGCLVVSTITIDCLEKLVPEMIYYVTSGTLKSTHLI